MSREKQSSSAKAPHSSADSPPALVPITPVAGVLIKKPFKINPIPKFDLSKFDFSIPEGEWCCPWIK